MVDLLIMMWVFFKIGLFTIGGGYAMIPMIESEAVSRGWVSLTQMFDFLAISESSPGPFAINMATFIGYTQFGVIGAIMATFSVALPSFLIILVVAKFFTKFSSNKYVQYALNGIRPVVIGLLFSVIVKLFLTVLFPDGFLLNAVEWKSLIILALVFFLSKIKKNIHPIYLILYAALLGLLFYGVL